MKDEARQPTHFPAPEAAAHIKNHCPGDNFANSPLAAVTISVELQPEQ